MHHRGGVGLNEGLSVDRKSKKQTLRYIRWPFFSSRVQQVFRVYTCRLIGFVIHQLPCRGDDLNQGISNNLLVLVYSHRRNRLPQLMIVVPPPYLGDHRGLKSDNFRSLLLVWAMRLIKAPKQQQLVRLSQPASQHKYHIQS